jgi:hypothetical protein
MTDYALQPQIFYSGAYHAIAADRVASPQGITYTRGVDDELGMQKGELRFRCYDDDDTYRPTNPESALYGIIGQYLPFLYQLDGHALYAGELETLTPGQTDDHQTTAKITTKGLRWVDFKVSGPIGTVGRWRDVVASPLRTQIRALTTVRAYWPGEDGPNATVMSAGMSTTGPALVSGVTFANADGPAGSNKLLTLGATARVDGRFPTNVSTNGWQIQFTSNCAGADATERLVFAWTTSNGYNWAWSASTTTYNLTVTDDVGSVLLNTSIGNGGVTPGKDIVFRLKMSKSGANWTYEPGWYAEDSPVLTGATGTFVGTAGRPVTWLAKTNTIMNGAYLGHVFLCDGVTEDLQSGNMINAINSYPGETTAARYRRILIGRGIPLEVLGDEAKATKMGPQRPGTLKAQLQEIISTEFGLIFESPAGRGLRFALRNYLYTQANTPALTLAYPADVGGGFTELATTLELYNTVIAQDASGISATAQQVNGRYGTADPPAGIGVLDKTINVNLLNAGDVVQVASAYLNFFQQVERFGPITVDLDNNPGLRTAVEAVDVGMFIKVTGRTPEPQLFMVVRCGGTDLLKRHLVTFEHVPGGVFATGTWGDGVHRHDLESSVTSGAWTTTTTAVTFTHTANEDWSLTTPYDLLVAGERVRVTAMNARTGTGPWTQTATVQRSINGVVKAQASGTPVHIADGGTWGWG